MRIIGGSAVLAAAGLAACASDTLGPPEYLQAKVKQLTDDVFVVGIEGRNVDEYAFARCVAADYAKYQEREAVGELAGAPLHTRYLNVEGKRVLHSYGVRQFTVALDGEPEPERVLPVRETLAECRRNGIPTGLSSYPAKAAAG